MRKITRSWPAACITLALAVMLNTWLGFADDLPLLKAGVAVRTVTPDPLLPVSGGVGPSRPMREKKGELTVRALVLEQGSVRVAVGSVDFLGFPTALCNNVRKLVPHINRENILIGATHTHSAPDCYAFPDKDGRTSADLDYLERVCREMTGELYIEEALRLIRESPAPGEPPTDPSWISLFDGKTLEGWTVKCKPADRSKQFWKVDQQSILADSLGQKGHDYVWLATNREYSNFLLRLEFQAFRSSPGNSGVQIRSRYDDGEFWLNGPQIDINPPGAWRTGMMWDETRGNQRWIHPDLPKDKWVDESMAKPSRVMYYAEDGDLWNLLEISAIGTEIRASLNGLPITDYDGKGLLDDPLHQEKRVGMKGVIALQIHTGDQLKIRFRNIRVKPLE